MGEDEGIMETFYIKSHAAFAKTSSSDLKYDTGDIKGPFNLKIHFTWSLTPV